MAPMEKKLHELFACLSRSPLPGKIYAARADKNNYPACSAPKNQDTQVKEG
jgi:hypothetical protein